MEGQYRHKIDRSDVSEGPCHVACGKTTNNDEVKGSLVGMITRGPTWEAFLCPANHKGAEIAPRVKTARTTCRETAHGAPSWCVVRRTARAAPSMTLACA